MLDASTSYQALRRPQGERTGATGLVAGLLISAALWAVAAISIVVL